jgi:hypothetical protein
VLGDLDPHVRHAVDLGSIGALLHPVHALAAVVLVGACVNPGDPTSPDPVRFLRSDRQPCRIVFGPVAADPSEVIEEQAIVETPDGPTTVTRAVSLRERPPPDVEIDRIDIYLSTVGGRSEATWLLPPTVITVSTASLDEEQLRTLLPELVRAGSVHGTAALLAEHIDGARLRFETTGPSPRTDLAVVDAEQALLYASRGAVLPEGAEEVDAATFVDAVEALLDGPPVVSISDGFALAPACAPDDGARTAGAVTGVEIAESDVGDILRISFEGLPPDDEEPHLVRVALGGVELVAEYQGESTLEFPATFTHVESRLLRDALSVRSGG